MDDLLPDAWSWFADDDLGLRAIRAEFAATWDVETFQSNLERYWKNGKGAARIRWGTPGDFTRCDRFLRKHVGAARSKRICAQWHKDKNGFWPGDRRNR